MVNIELCKDIHIEQDNGIRQHKVNKGNVQEVSVKEPVTNESVDEVSFIPNEYVEEKISSTQSIIGEVLIESTEEDKRFVLKENCHSAYYKLQRALASEQVLSHTNDRDKIISITDANDNAVLPQVQDENCKGKTAHCDVLKLRISKFDNVSPRDNNVVKNRKVSR